MTEGNKSVLKTALGLENLKGLGDTLKQIKEAKESLDEVLKMTSELAKDNSPLGLALARLIEAQGLKTLNEDNINISEEVRKTMQESLKNREETIEDLEAENKGLKEDKVISEVTRKLTSELDQRLPKPGSQGNGSGESKLFKAIEDVVAKKLEQLLGGSGGASTLTSDEIRKVVKEEMAAVSGGNKKPDEMVEDLVNALTMGDRLREKLGGAGIGAHLLQDQGGNSGLRTDLVKLLLEDERDRLRIQQNHEVEVERNKHIGTLTGLVKENLGPGIAALTLAAEAERASHGNKTPPQQPQQQVRCSCGVLINLPAEAEDWLEIQCSQCKQVWTREQVKETLGA